MIIILVFSQRCGLFLRPKFSSKQNWGDRLSGAHVINDFGLILDNVSEGWPFLQSIQTLKPRQNLIFEIQIG